MAVELVTGHSGEAHVSSMDVRRLHVGIFGGGSYVLGDAPAVDVVDANHVRVGPCVIMTEGAEVILSGVSSIPIQSGAQTGRRTDLVCLRYSIAAGTFVESSELVVVTGVTSDEAPVPAVPNPGKVLDGATVSDVPVARVTLEGLVPSVEWLLPCCPSLGDLPQISVGEAAAPEKGAPGSVYIQLL